MDSDLHVFLSYAEEIRTVFLRSTVLLQVREPSVKELALLTVVFMNAIPLSNTLAFENDNDQDEWPLPCFKSSFSKTMVSQDVLKGTSSEAKRFHSVHTKLSKMKKKCIKLRKHVCLSLFIRGSVFHKITILFCCS